MTMPEDIRQVIEGNHLFEGLSTDLIKKITSSATRKTAAAGEILFQKGDPADALWGVLSGQVVVEIGTEDGKELVLDVFREGDVFGEVGVLDFGPRLVEARAAQKSQLFRLERKHFLRLLQSSPELCFRVFILLCSHLRDTTENLEETALYKLPGRLAKRLVMLATDPTTGNSSVLHISQSELASMLGVNREAVNRHLRVFEKKGMVALGRKVVEVLDREALSKLASPGRIHHRTTWETEDLVTIDHAGFASTTSKTDVAKMREHYPAALLAVDAAEYSRSLLSDAAGTLKRIETGLKAVDQAIRQYRGNTVWHTGDRILAKFPDSQRAVAAALAIQERVNPAKDSGKDQQLPIFRIGLHQGEVLVDEHGYSGEAVNTVIRLTQLYGAEGIMISGAVRDALEVDEQLELRFLGDHELKNVAGKVPVYSVRAIPMFKALVLRAETLVPRRFRPATIAAAIIVLLAGVWFTGDKLGRQPSQLTASHLSIAVLPFTGTVDPSLGYLAEGIPDEVRAALFTIPGIRVVGRDSSGYFRDRESGVAEIGRALGVAWLLRGNLQSSNDGTLATLQLYDAANGELVWNEQFRESGEGFSNLAAIIVERIGVSMGLAQEDGAGIPQFLPLTSNAEAHRLYLEAQSLIWLGRGRNMVDAVPLLQSAVELDPAFAEAHAILATLYKGVTMLDKHGAYNPGLRQELARQSLQTALSLKPDSSLVLAKAAEVCISDHDYEGAQALLDRALKIDPNNTAALQSRTRIESIRLDWANALKTSKQWLQLEPLSVIAMNIRIGALWMADRYQEILSIANRALTFYPESEVPFMHANVALAKLNLGDRLGAIEAARRGMPYGEPFDLWAGLEYDWGFFDDLDPMRAAVGLVYIEEYEQVRQLLIETWGSDNPESGEASTLKYLVNRAELEALAGDIGRAREFFDRAWSLTSDQDGGLVRAEVSYNVLDWSRQSHFSVAALFVYRKAGLHEKANVISEQIEDLLDEHIAAIAAVSDQAEYRFLYKRAQYHAIEGRDNEALALLRAWVDRGVEIFTYIKWDPFMENLRGDPKFEAIVAEVEAKLADVRAHYHARQAEVNAEYKD